MRYAFKSKKCKCGGLLEITPSSSEMQKGSIVLECIWCKYTEVYKMDYAEAMNKHKKPLLIATTISRYGIGGDNTDTYINIETHPDKIFVFGDNLIKKGKGGQAMIRDAQNAFGIPTKRLPSMSQDSFFSDKEEEDLAVLASLRTLYTMSLKGKEIVFPLDGLGSGLAEMDKRSPILYKKMNNIIKDYWNISLEQELEQGVLF